MATTFSLGSGPFHFYFPFHNSIIRKKCRTRKIPNSQSYHFLVVIITLVVSMAHSLLLYPTAGHRRPLLSPPSTLFHFHCFILLFFSNPKTSRLTYYYSKPTFTFIPKISNFRRIPFHTPKKYLFFFPSQNHEDIITEPRKLGKRLG